MEMFERKIFGPRIVVMGIGGAGGNAVNSMLREKIGQGQDPEARHLGVV